MSNNNGGKFDDFDFEYIGLPEPLDDFTITYNEIWGEYYKIYNSMTKDTRWLENEDSYYEKLKSDIDKLSKQAANPEQRTRLKNLLYKLEKAHAFFSRYAVFTRTGTPAPGDEETKTNDEEYNSIDSLSDEELKDILKKSGWKNIDDNVIKGLRKAIKECELNTKDRFYNFLASITAEGNYNRKDENGNLVLEDGNQKFKKASLGGGKYRGAGYLQLTHDYNYEGFAESITEKYGDDKRIMKEGAEYVAEKYPWDSAIWYWNKNDVNLIIDNGGNPTEVTKKIKGKNATVSKRRQAAFDAVKKAIDGIVF